MVASVANPPTWWSCKSVLRRRTSLWMRACLARAAASGFFSGVRRLKSSSGGFVCGGCVSDGGAGCPGRDEDERLEMLGRPAVLRRAPDEIRVRVGREIEAAGARRAVARMAIDRLAARDPARHAEKTLVDAGEFRLERRAGAYSLQAL